MSEIEFEERPQLARDDVDRSWRREYAVTGVDPMVNEGAKFKKFRPETVIIEFSRHNESAPTLDKVVFRGPFLAADGVGQRVYTPKAYKAELPVELRAKIDAIIAAVSGAAPTDSLLAKIARRANGWDSEPFTPEEERVWEAYQHVRPKRMHRA
jgi:hypothetical protein